MFLRGLRELSEKEDTKKNKHGGTESRKNTELFLNYFRDPMCTQCLRGKK